MSAAEDLFNLVNRVAMQTLHAREDADLSAVTRATAANLKATRALAEEVGKRLDLIEGLLQEKRR